MLTIKAMTGGETYVAHHLSNNDYYAVGESITGEWIGRGAQLLGLEGAVNMEQFEAIRQGVSPSSGDFLRPRQSADRLMNLARSWQQHAICMTSPSQLRRPFLFKHWKILG